MTSPVISIVLPTFNGSRYLAESIESCLAQTFTEWELIIVDDASDDSTPQIIDRYVALDSRIRSVRHSTNRKLPAALNTGFAQARGSYFTWTSDDNLYKPTALENMYNTLMLHAGAGGVYASYDVIDEHGVSLSSVKAVDQSSLVFGNYAGPCFLYLRSVAEQVGAYDENLFLVEDYDFWLRVSHTYRMVPLMESLYLYRTHSMSLTVLKERHISKLHALVLVRNLPEIHWISRKQQLAGWLTAAALFVQVKDWRMALLAVARAFMAAPVMTMHFLVKMKLNDRSVLNELMDSSPPCVRSSQ